MGKIEYQDEKRALVRSADDDAPVATLYRLTDGWHAKLAHLHTKRAWSGPYESPEEALGLLA